MVSWSIFQQAVEGSTYIQMDGHTPRAEIIDLENTTDHIATQIIEDQHFPYGLSFGIEYWCCLRYQAIRGRRFMMVFGLTPWFLVEIEQLLNRR